MSNSEKNDQEKIDGLPSRVSRRDFLRGSGAVVGAAAIAAGSAGLLGGCAKKTTSSQYEWEDSADVVVIGSGSGLMAAYRAAKAGASVIVLEKRPTLGGETGLSGGVFYAGGTSVQQAAGTTDARTGKADTVEGCLADWKTHAVNGYNEALASKIVGYGPEIIDFFAKQKDLYFFLYQSGTDPVDRGHCVSHDKNAKAFTPGSGGLYIEVLRKEFETAGGKIHTGTRAIEILTDDNMSILGVKAKTAEGAIKYYGCKAVILAAGGPDDNTDLTMMYNSEAIKWTNFGSTLSMGDGFYLAEKFDVNVVGQQNWLDYATPNPALLAVVNYKPVEEPIVAATDVYGKAGKRPVIDINKNGERFADELKGYPNYLGVDIARQDDGYAWCISDADYFTVDDGILAAFFEGAYKMDPDELVEEGLFLRADSLADLAAQMGMASDLLDGAVNRWNSLVAAGADTDFNRPVNTLMAIKTAPFYAYRLTPGFAVPQGGAYISLDIDENCRCVDRGGMVIPGLYAIGTGNAFLRAYGRGYPGSGSNNAAGFGMGIVAGEHVANYVKSL
ncbi:MAG: FAD-dependent oxidoreductase [Coriobacteriia bacterium]